MVTTDYLIRNNDIVGQLKKIPALQSFQDGELQDLLRFSEIRDYKAESIIVEEGKSEGWIYYLVSGRVKITKKDKDLVVLESTGDIFGEMGAIDGSVRSASVVTVEPSVCLALNVRDIDELSGNNRFAFRYIIYREFANVLATRLRETTEELIKAREELEKLSLVNRLVTVTEELAKAQKEIAELRKKVGP